VEMLFLMLLIEGNVFNVMLTLPVISSLNLARHDPSYFENVIRISSGLTKTPLCGF